MNLVTKQMPLVVDGYRCVGGPLDGATLLLSEHSQNTARIECQKQRGRYVAHPPARLLAEGDRVELVWEPT